MSDWRIYQYNIALDVTDQVIEMHEGATILSIGKRTKHPCVFALVDATRPLRMRRIAIVLTGRTTPDVAAADFIGTMFMDHEALVFHVFDCGEVST